MIDTPQIVQSPAQRTAVIHLTVPREDIQKVMGPAIGELMGALAAAGIAPAGPLFSHHLKRPTEIFDFEVGVPVGAAIRPAGRVAPGELRAATVARTIYRGGYEGLGAAWGEFEAWLTREGHTPAPDLWECYVQGPESGADPAAWRTELNRPLAR